MTDAPPRLALRRLPAPDCEPPFDDELGDLAGVPGGRGTTGEARSPAVQGTLALAFVLPNGILSVPEAPPDLRLVPRPGAAEEDLDAAEFGPQPTPRSDLPEPRGWAGRFAQALVEVLEGDRPVGQLVRWTSAEVYDDVVARFRRRQGRAGSARAVVRSVHLAEPADGVAEVAAVVRRGARTTAVALRLEGLDGRWQCTALELR
jgi:hypothetical protein